MVNLFSLHKTRRVTKGGREEDFPLPDLNKFSLPKTENMSFLMLYFKLQA